uniref:TPX2_importin domain-containing protein n=1 Tax=Macrostomum lignano TaxID=282301 RepID=A0A1I8JP75_9PLAT
AVVARIREIRLQKDNGVLGLRLQKKPDPTRPAERRRSGVENQQPHRHGLVNGGRHGAAEVAQRHGANRSGLSARLSQLQTWRGRTDATDLPLPSHNKHRNQQAQTLQRQSDEAKSQNSRRTISKAKHRSMVVPSRTSQPGSAAPAAANAVPTEKEENRRPKVPDSNPCASTTILEITRLRVPPEAAGEAKRQQQLLVVQALPSFHAPNRLTAFLKSSRFSRQQSQPQSKQQQSDAKANTSLPAVEASISAEKGFCNFGP